MVYCTPGYPASSSATERGTVELVAAPLELEGVTRRPAIDELDDAASVATPPAVSEERILNAAGGCTSKMVLVVLC